jgi:CubicO group peptidase (beta-lactamase class C family)
LPSAGAPDLTPPAAGVQHTRLDDVIDRAFLEPDRLHQRRTRAVIVVHHGRIVGERYAAGIGPQTALVGWSMTKSVVNALVGILVKQGRISIAAPAPVPEWQQPGDPRGQITLDQLLRMSSGVAFDEGRTNLLSDSIRMLTSGDVAAYAIGKPLAAAPGRRWRYSSGTTNIIARVIRTVVADDREYWMLPRRLLFDRIGMTGAVIETDAAGTFVGSSFMYATARDWARFGMLYLQDGTWNGERILPEGWVDYTQSRAPADATGRYGAHFWLEIPPEYRGRGASLPGDAFHAAGYEAQFVTIVPSRNAVIVRLGVTRYHDAWDHATFVHDVLAALPPGP